MSDEYILELADDAWRVSGAFCCGADYGECVQ